MWSTASSTFSGSPVTVTQLGSGAPLCGKRMSTWKERGRRLRWPRVPVRRAGLKSPSGGGERSLSVFPAVWGVWAPGLGAAGTGAVAPSHACTHAPSGHGQGGRQPRRGGAPFFRPAQETDQRCQLHSCDPTWPRRRRDKQPRRSPSRPCWLVGAAAALAERLGPH